MVKDEAAEALGRKPGERGIGSMSLQRAPQPAIPEVRSIFRNLTAAWTSGDAEMFASLWTEDAILWLPTGEELHGRRAIRKWAAEFGDIRKYLAMDVLRAERLGGVVFALGNFTQDLDAPSGMAAFRGGFTSVLVSMGEGCQIHRLVAFEGRPFRISSRSGGTSTLR